MVVSVALLVATVAVGDVADGIRFIEEISFTTPAVTLAYSTLLITENRRPINPSPKVYLTETALPICLD